MIELTTNRAILSALQAKDALNIFKLRSNKQNATYLNRPLALSIQEASLFIEKIIVGISKKECIYWGIRLKNEQELIGTICFWEFAKGNTSAEIGYELLPGYQGKGIMQEVVKTVILYGFEQLKLEKITANVHPKNDKSIQLLKRNNFILEENSEEKFYLLSS